MYLYLACSKRLPLLKFPPLVLAPSDSSEMESSAYGGRGRYIEYPVQVGFDASPCAVHGECTPILIEKSSLMNGTQSLVQEPGHTNTKPPATAHHCEDILTIADT
jgi:hypothetical protein